MERTLALRTRLGIWASAFFFTAVTSVGVLADAIDDLQPGHWYQVPNSRLNVPGVAPNPVPPGTDGVAAVMNSWSGAAYDTTRDRLIVFGGGHNNYSGNEIYVFNFNRNDASYLRWSRLTDPSNPVGGSEASGYYGDGLPRSRHSYNFIEYVPPPFDRFCSFGAGGTYPSSSTSIPNVDCFNFGNLQWERKANAPSGSTFTRIGSKAVYDPVDNRVYLQTGLGGDFSSYNPATNTWQIHDSSSFMEYETTAAIDPTRRVMVAIGRGGQFILNLNNPASGFSNLSSSGDNGIIGVDAPGLAYDPISDQFVAWHGGTDVYTLKNNGSSWVWTRVRPAGTNTVVPTPAAIVGTYGRFRYIPSRNVFLAVNDVNENVYVYKVAAGGGTPAAPTLQFTSTTYSVGEAGGSVTIGVSRVGSSVGAVTVNYATSNGTAAGADYTSASGVLSWADGETATKTFTVAVTNDTDVETNETVNLTLSNPTNGAVLGQASAVLTIVDNDGPATIAFERATYSAGESAGSATIRVIRSGNTSNAVSVNYSTGNGTALAGADYTTATGVLSFAAGVTSQTFTVSIVNDTDDEVNETVILTLNNPGGAVLGGPFTAVLTITDNDSAPPVSVSGSSEEAGGGCSLRRGSNFDPILPLLALLAAVQLLRRARVRGRNSHPSRW